MNSLRRLEDRVAIITGAGSGIGRATAERLADEGARLVLADIHEAPLREIAKKIEEKGGSAHVQITDVSDEEQVKEMISAALNRWEKVDILCNNAGIVGDVNALDQQDGEIWQQVYAVNVLGAVYAVKHIAGHMMSRRTGSIVNTSSIAGIRAGAGGNAYSASKAAMINFTQTSACDLGSYNVRVNAVCPGLIETGMTRAVFDMARQAGKGHKLGSRCELKRYGNPEEIASVIAFLASDDASFMTGQALAVDGGNTASLNLPGMKF